MFMQLLNQKSQVYFNFLNSLDSQVTKKTYEFCLSKFLSHCELDLISFLKLPQEDISNLIIRYLVAKKISRQYKKLIFSAIKHACEMNDVILNWKKMKKFMKAERTGNEINGKDRGYTHQEIQRIIDFSDQRLKTAFLILASTGVRAGVLCKLQIGNLQRINDVYKLTVYAGERRIFRVLYSRMCKTD